MTAPTITPLNLALALSAIREGEKIAASGQVNAGLRLVGYGADYLQSFLPQIDPRLASEIGIAADNLRQKAEAI